MTDRQIIRPKYGQIPLGKQGENEVREVRFDLPPNLRDCEWTLNHRRATDAAAYPVALDRVGDELVWTIRSGDVAIPGRGELELTCISSDGRILKSETYPTQVVKAVDVGGEAPEPITPYLARLAQAAASAEQQANEARLSADAAALNATTSAEKAAEAAKYAETAQHIEMDWNADDGQPGHIKNRTHWAKTVTDVIGGTGEVYTTPNSALAYAYNADVILALHAYTIGQKYRVVVNGVEHLLQFEAGEQDPRRETGWCYFGFNIDPFNAELKDSSVGAALYFRVGVDEADITPGATAEGELICAVPAGVKAPVTVEVYDPQEVIHPLEEKYIPDSIPRQSDIPAGVFFADCERHYDEEDWEETCLFSTTFAEINAAIQRGEFVVARLKTGDATDYFPLVGADRTYVTFSQLWNEEAITIKLGVNGFSDISYFTFIDEDYFYDIFEYEHLYLNSPNGTRFKITVDDSGTLSATEV